MLALRGMQASTDVASRLADLVRSGRDADLHSGARI
jgi:hypothetical protein